MGRYLISYNSDLKNRSSPDHRGACEVLSTIILLVGQQLFVENTIKITKLVY